MKRNELVVVGILSILPILALMQAASNQRQIVKLENKLDLAITTLENHGHWANSANQEGMEYMIDNRIMIEDVQGWIDSLNDLGYDVGTLPPMVEVKQ